MVLLFDLDIKRPMCEGCFGSIEGESCGWPKGTVRACVALITIPLGFLSSIIIMIILVVKEQYTVALGVNSVIWGVVGSIIGHYFGSKQAEGAAKMMSQTEHELIESRNLEISRGGISMQPITTGNPVHSFPSGYRTVPVVHNSPTDNPNDTVIDNNNNNTITL